MTKYYSPDLENYPFLPFSTKVLQTPSSQGGVVSIVASYMLNDWGIVFQLRTWVKNFSLLQGTQIGSEVNPGSYSLSLGG